MDRYSWKFNLEFLQSNGKKTCDLTGREWDFGSASIKNVLCAIT